MITFLEGILVEKQPTRVVVNVGGVGYEVFISVSSYERLPAENRAVRILVYDHIREDQHALFGFMTPAERKMFVMLLGITGIGPKLALSALSGLPPKEIRAAVLEGDVKRLSAITGIGKKTAERIVVELRHKLTAADELEAAAADGPEPAAAKLARDAVMALVSLGYKQADAQKKVHEIVRRQEPVASVEDMVRRALTLP